MKFMTDEFYVKSAEEMRELFADVPDACDNTLAIVKRIDIKIPEKQFNIPVLPGAAGRRRRSARASCSENRPRSICASSASGA